jgi:hypothetical protein
MFSTNPFGAGLTNTTNTAITGTTNKGFGNLFSGVATGAINTDNSNNNNPLTIKPQTNETKPTESSNSAVNTSFGNKEGTTNNFFSSSTEQKPILNFGATSTNPIGGALFNKPTEVKTETTNTTMTGQPSLFNTDPNKKDTNNPLGSSSGLGGNFSLSGNNNVSLGITKPAEDKKNLFGNVGGASATTTSNTLLGTTNTTTGVPTSTLPGGTLNVTKPVSINASGK